MMPLPCAILIHSVVYYIEFVLVIIVTINNDVTIIDSTMCYKGVVPVDVAH